MKYTFSDEDEDIYSDATSTRRSTRNTGTHTPAEPSGPTITQSGRQVKARQGGAYGESMLSGQAAAGEENSDGTEAEATSGRPRRAAATNHTRNGWPANGGRHIEGYNDVDEMTSDEEGDASEQDYGMKRNPPTPQLQTSNSLIGDDEEEDDIIPLESDVEDQDELTDEEDVEMEASEKKKLIIKLPVKTPTPERKPPIKLRMSPAKESSKASGLFPATTTNSSQAAASGSAQSASVPEVEIKEHTEPSSNESSNIIINASEASSKPINIPPPSPSHQPQSPLAFRGSPEKPHLPPSINVGYGGS